MILQSGCDTTWADPRHGQDRPTTRTLSLSDYELLRHATCRCRVEEGPLAASDVVRLLGRGKERVCGRKKEEGGNGMSHKQKTKPKKVLKIADQPRRQIREFVGLQTAQ